MFWAFSLLFSGIIGAFSVIISAVAAHAFPEIMQGQNLIRVEKATTFSFYHVIVLLFLFLVYERFPLRIWQVAAVLNMSGILLFCGSLLIAAFTPHSGVLVAAPIGGSCFIFSWLCIAFGAVLLRRNNNSCR